MGYVGREGKMTKKEAIQDAKLKQKMFPDIGNMYILRRKKKDYISVSETYYKARDFMKEYRVRKVI